MDENDFVATIISWKPHEVGITDTDWANDLIFSLREELNKWSQLTCIKD